MDYMLPKRKQMRFLLLWAGCLSATAAEQVVLVGPDVPLPSVVSTGDAHDRDAAATVGDNPLKAHSHAIFATGVKG